MHDKTQIMQQLKAWANEANRGSVVKTEPSQQQFDAPSYAIFDGCLFYLKKMAKSEQTVRLTNFVCAITDEITKLDGENGQRFFRISGKLKDGRTLPELLIPAEELDKCDWVVQHWGAQPQITVGTRHKDHLVAAIKELSNPAQKVTRLHTGWVVENGKHGYITNSGKIAIMGLDQSVETELQGSLENYDLPKPISTNPDSPESILQLMDSLLPNGMGLALFSAVCRSVLSYFARNTMTVFIQGSTGSYKSAIAGVLLSFFGKNFDGFNLSDNWTSTSNALEKKAYLCADALFVIDDFVTRGTANDVNKINSKAERVIRAQGNLAGRDRLTATTELRGSFVPRGMILATGEDLPAGHSLRARMLTFHISKGSVDTNALTELQNLGACGELAQRLADFIYWLAMMADTHDVRSAVRNALEKNRLKYLGSGHSRAPDNMASILVGLHFYLMFAKNQTDLCPDIAQAFMDKAERAVIQTASEQAESEKEVSDAERFVSLLRTAISMGLGHFRLRSGGHPKSPTNFGWREIEVKDGYNLVAQGSLLGYVDDRVLYIDMEACLAVIRPLSSRSGNYLGISASSLKKALKEAGYIARHEAGRNTIKVVCEGKRCTFMCLDGEKVMEFIGKQLHLDLESDDD